MIDHMSTHTESSSGIWYVDELRPDGDAAIRGFFRSLDDIRDHALAGGFVRGEEWGPKYAEFVHPETRHVIQCVLYGFETWLSESGYE